MDDGSSIVDGMTANLGTLQLLLARFNLTFQICDYMTPSAQETAEPDNSLLTLYDDRSSNRVVTRNGTEMHPDAVLTSQNSPCTAQPKKG